ncbi:MULTISPECIES: hypothetical protein [Natrialba]|nr:MULTISPECIES: hypothetical protein [Natrialba]
MNAGLLLSSDGDFGGIALESFDHYFQAFLDAGFNLEESSNRC